LHLSDNGGRLPGKFHLFKGASHLSDQISRCSLKRSNNNPSLHFQRSVVSPGAVDCDYNSRQCGYDRVVTPGRGSHVERVRVRIIGTSWCGDVTYVPSMRNYPGAEVVAICDRDCDHVAEVVGKFSDVGRHVAASLREQPACHAAL
jgi:hypothetical protein